MGNHPADRAKGLSRRERQIMDAVYAAGEASVTRVLTEITDPPSYSAVRAFLRILEDKGYLRHRTDGSRYVYFPTRARSRAGRSAMRRVVKTFFNDSAVKAMAALIDVSDARLSDEELAELQKLIDQSKSKAERS